MSEHKVEQTFRAGKTRIQVIEHQAGDGLRLIFHVRTDHKCCLHWGLRKRRDKHWHAPPAELWPPDTEPFDVQAVQSPLVQGSDSERSLQIRLPAESSWRILSFVLYFPDQNRWLNGGGKDFNIALPRSPGELSADDALRARTADGPWRRQSFELGDGDRLATGVLETDEQINVLIACDIGSPLILHWGMSDRYRFNWTLPPTASWPQETVKVDSKAVQTPFIDHHGLSWLELEFKKTGNADALRGLNFVLYAPETGQWLKAGHSDMHLMLSQAPVDERGSFGSSLADTLGEEIIGAEMGKNSWTLMHRFNLCHGLLSGAEKDPQALALLYTWLRYSAIRQLDWQRHYNTKPRELSHAQDRLTLRLADIYMNQRVNRRWTRLMLTTMGPGGEGQKVRDEILNIMHRQKIKEVHGTFMEEWHQKLHNNTTPDDIVICEAYLAFLESGGDLNSFYTTLEQKGVTRERLQSFERPIKTDPIFYGDKKAGLMGDFQHFLGILRSVHSGTDIESASARSHIGDALNQQLDSLLSLRSQEAPAEEQADAITVIRNSLARQIHGQKNAHTLRDLLYLDLALEAAMRASIEQQALHQAELGLLSSLVHAALQNLCFSEEAEEFSLLVRQLEKLIAQTNDEVDWALRMKSVTDRLGRAIGEWSNELYEMLQPKAKALGKALAVETWTIPLFSEEIIRGSPAFMLSLLLRPLDPILRERAGLGGWQVISPGKAAGQVRVVDNLLAIQGDTYVEPTVIVTDVVSGDEEIPGGVTSVITSDTPDLVSHVAVRARNAHVLFATCFEAEAYEQLKTRQGQRLALHVSPAGDVEVEAVGAPSEDKSALKEAQTLRVRPRSFSSWAVTSSQFTDEIVGGKSNNLNGLQGNVSNWIQFPASLALPFGVFEESLRDAQNQELKQDYETLLNKLTQDPEKQLPRIRALLLKLQHPVALQEALRAAWQSVGLASVEPEPLRQAINRVWAAKWNERAYYSRVTNGVAHKDLMIAVLIQQVVNADYAFVIHTVNPMTGSEDELFAEVVLGMGETLVGNYPGRALGFVCQKSELGVQMLSYPSKSIGLYGQGVIFRSDSNGEDLEGFAGAGLYDSFLAEAPKKRRLDYTEEPLIQDAEFRRELLQNIARIGIEVERACGSAQDIEGAIQGGEYYVVQTRPQVGL